MTSGLDCWSSRANHSFMSLTFHYISTEWDMKSHMLETGEITVDYMAINLSNYLKEGLGRWNLALTKSHQKIPISKRN